MRVSTLDERVDDTVGNVGASVNRRIVAKPCATADSVLDTTGGTSNETVMVSWSLTTDPPHVMSTSCKNELDACPIVCVAPRPCTSVHPTVPGDTGGAGVYSGVAVYAT